VFRGTRIPVVALFENLVGGVTQAEFFELFAGVSLAQARLVFGISVGNQSAPT
jgi:uncharacterized protein (DUF433 family)